MTLTDLNTKYPRLIVPQPFASKTGAAMTPITDGSESTVGNVVNFKDGFPAIYATPQSGGGKYVGRGDMNALGDLASRNQFRRLCGVINTFDSDFCTKIGGYPEGMVLQYLDGNYLYDVISLVDNNTVDFRTTGVDNTNWRKLNITSPSDSPITICDVSTGNVGDSSAASNQSVAVCTYKTPRIGVVSQAVTLTGQTLVAGQTRLVALFLNYKKPSDTEWTKPSVPIWSCGAAIGSSGLAEPIQFPAGTLLQAYLNIDNVLYSNIRVVMTLV